MEISITSKDFKVTETIRDNIQSELDRLSRWNINFINPHVILSTTPEKNFAVEVKILIPKSELLARDENKDIYTAISEVFHKIEIQLNKYSEKLKHHQE